MDEDFDTSILDKVNMFPNVEMDYDFSFNTMHNECMQQNCSNALTMHQVNAMLLKSIVKSQTHASMEEEQRWIASKTDHSKYAMLLA